MVPEQEHDVSEGTLEGYGLSPQQRRLWERQELAPKTGLSATLVVDVHGPLLTAELVSALEALIARHEILHSAFRVLPDTSIPVQLIVEPPALDLQEVDLRSRPASEANSEIETLARKLGTTPYDLATGKTLRVALVRTAAEATTLVLAQSALAGDVTSLENLVSELAAELAGESATDTDEPLQYADVAQWQEDMFSSDEAPDGLAFWRKLEVHGSDFRHPFELDDTSSARGGAECELRLDANELELLVGTAEQLSVAPEALVAAVWARLLSSAVDADRLLLAVAFPGRSYEGLDVAQGPFEKALPLPLRILPDDTLASLARRYDDEAGKAEEWFEFFDPKRLPGAAHGTLGFAWYEPGDERTAGATTFRPRLVRGVPDAFRLGLACCRVHDGLRLRLATTHLGQDDARLLLRQLRTGLVHALAAPEAGLLELEWADDTERTRVASHVRDADLPATEAGRNVLERFAERVAQVPDAIAVRASGEALTYEELDRRSNRLARWLASRGVARGDIVGVFLDRCVDLVTALLAVQKAGAAYLPLPPGYPAERIAFMLADSGTTVVVSRSADAGKLGAFDGTTVLFDADAADIDKLDSRSLDELPPLSAAAYVIYTSGSSGQPKGVPITHANLAFSTAARLAYYRQPVSAYLLASSFAFDSSVAGLFWTLADGGTLVLPDDGFEREIPALPARIAAGSISHILCLPSLWGLILEHAREDELASLRTVIVAGEACPVDLVRRHAERLETTPLFNEYGPTEATVWSTVFACAALEGRTPVPIGRPIPGARVHVLDPQGRPTPLGLAGEICIGGPGLAAGYLDRPELTAEKFGTHATTGERIYRTGDRGRWFADGQLEFLGRLDSQVKVRGYRIELEEIEAVLSTHADVTEAAVVVARASADDDRLVALFVPREGRTPDESALAAWLAAPLPDYMQPSRFVPVDTLPHLPNGKIDRKSLPAPETLAATRERVIEAPDTALETLLCGIWADVLSLDTVGVNEDFFALGGHSILATRLFARVIEDLEIELPLRLLFDHPSVGSFARHLVRDEVERDRIERTAKVILQVMQMDDDEAEAALGEG